MVRVLRLGPVDAQCGIFCLTIFNINNFNFLIEFILENIRSCACDSYIDSTSDPSRKLVGILGDQALRPGSSLQCLKTRNMYMSSKSKVTFPTSTSAWMKNGRWEWVTTHSHHIWEENNWNDENHFLTAAVFWSIWYQMLNWSICVPDLVRLWAAPYLFE